MAELVYDCDCDLVLELQELGVGVEEVLQYARGCFSREEIRALIAGLEPMLPAPVPVEQFYG